MDDNLLESLLHDSEGAALDFKQSQYRWGANSNADEQSERLKDVLAFANSWRRGDAYILIGVKAVQGGRHEVVGTEDHFDEAQLQQFVNYKTSRKVLLSYEVYRSEGKKIGVIRIPKQDRPTYATKPFGKVKENVVYYRLGSSTAVATPQDIARMGADDAVQKRALPTLELRFADAKTREALGESIELRPVIYEDHDPNTFPDADDGDYFGRMLHRTNRDYWREMAHYVQITSLLKPVGFVIHNLSGNLAENVRLQITGDNGNGYGFFDETEVPRRPVLDGTFPNIDYRNIGHRDTNVERHGEQWTLTVDFGNVQPKASVWADSPVYARSRSGLLASVEAVIYANNLPDPQRVTLTIKFSPEKRAALTIDDVEAADAKLTDE